MNINTNDKEKYEELKNKIIRIFEFDRHKELEIYNKNKSINSVFNDFARTNNVYKEYQLGENTVVFNRKSMIESLTRMNRSRYNITNLYKALTVADDVIENAVLISVEKYRHSTRNEKNKIKQVEHYLSAFCDDEYIYPVKITYKVPKKETDNNKIYMIIAVDKIKKEAVLNARVHSVNQSDESLLRKNASIDISLPDFVSKFNKKMAIIFKNLPDEFLNEHQLHYKEKAILKDKLEEEKRRIEKEIKKIDNETNIDNEKNIKKEKSKHYKKNKPKTITRS